MTINIEIEHETIEVTKHRLIMCIPIVVVRVTMVTRGKHGEEVAKTRITAVVLRFTYVFRKQATELFPSFRCVKVFEKSSLVLSILKGSTIT